MNNEPMYTPQFGYPQAPLHPQQQQNTSTQPQYQPQPYNQEVPQQTQQVFSQPPAQEDVTQNSQSKTDFAFVANKTRIAVYDDAFATPRIEEIQPDETRAYIGNIAARTYHLAKEVGGSIPYTVILELVENFIHAYFKEPVISILDEGNTIRFSDQGPGIEKKSLAQQPGFSSATEEMKNYIRGVGSGLPVVKSYLEVQSGRLLVEDNIKQGTVVTIAINPNSTVERHHVKSGQHSVQHLPKLNEREELILLYIERVGGARITDIAKDLDIPSSSTHKTVGRLSDNGYIELNDEMSGKHYTLTRRGTQTVELLHQREM